MINFKKYALAAALVIPSVFAMGANESEAAKATIDKSLAGGVNVRAEAAMGDNIIGLIEDGKKAYDIVEDGEEWIKIKFDDKEAYVAKRFFHILDEDKIISDANLREGDSLDDKVIRVLKEGTKVEVVEIADNGYVKVEFEENDETIEGYVYHNLLETFREANLAKEADAAPVVAKAQPAQTQTTTTTQTQVVSQPAPQPVEQQTYTGSSNWAKEWIAQRESGGSYTAYNPNGGYYGRYQLNPSLVHYGASPAEQEAAADAYVAQRYGSWEAAQAFWAANGWY